MIRQFIQNTCTDILGSENRYQAYVNVPGEANLDIESFRAVFKSKLGDLDLTVNYGYQGLKQSSQYDIDQGYNYAYGMSFNWNDLDVKTNVVDAFVNGSTDKMAYVVGAFIFNVKICMHLLTSTPTCREQLISGNQKELKTTCSLWSRNLPVE